MVPVRSPQGATLQLPAELAGAWRDVLSGALRERLAAHAGDGAHLGARVRAARARVTKPPKIASAVSRLAAAGARRRRPGAAAGSTPASRDPVAVALVPAVEHRAVDVGVELHAPRAADPERRAAEAAALEQLGGAGRRLDGVLVPVQGPRRVGHAARRRATRASSTHVTARRGQPADAAAERVGEQLGAEADAEHRHVALDRPRSSSASSSRYG